MPKVVISSTGVVNFPEGGGHFWVYMQYVHALRAMGCDVYWLERLYSTGDERKDADLAAAFQRKLTQRDMAGRALLYKQDQQQPISYLTATRAQAEAIFAGADLLLNFDYRIDPALLCLFQRTALIDIDPG